MFFLTWYVSHNKNNKINDNVGLQYEMPQKQKKHKQKHK